MLEARSVGVDYGGKAALVEASLRAEAGTVVGLIGPNGSGKSTLLRALSHHLRPRHGHVELDGVALSTLATRDTARAIAVVAQENPSDLSFTVAAMVMLGRSPHRRSWERFDRSDHRLVAETLARVGLRDRADDRYVELSGGERQRALIARALVQEATHVLLDEPTNHLDVRFQHEVLALVRSLQVVTVVVLHDLNLAARYCDELVLLDRGRVVRSGSVDEVARPEVLEPVYGITMERIDRPGRAPQLLFDPPGERRA